MYLETKIVNGNVKIRRAGSKSKFSLSTSKTGKRLLEESRIAEEDLKRQEAKEEKQAFELWRNMNHQNFEGIHQSRKQALPPLRIRNLLKSIKNKVAKQIVARKNIVFKTAGRIRNYRSINWGIDDRFLERQDEKKEAYDIITFLERIKLATINRIQTDIKQIGALKCRLVIVVEYKKGEGKFAEHMVANHETKMEVILSPGDVEDFVERKFLLLPTRAEEFQARGSGWNFSRIIKFYIMVDRYQPFAGGTYVETPKALANKKAIINVDNSDTKRMKGDNRCFKWSILAKLYPPSGSEGKRVKNLNRLSHYTPHQDKLNMDGLVYPIPATKRTFAKFERQNPTICLSVFAYEKGQFAYEKGQALSIIPIYIDGLNPTGIKVDLLLIESHYVLIKDISRLLSTNQSQHGHKSCVCRRCLYMTADNTLFINHERDCSGLNSGSDATPVRMPTKGEDDVCRFTGVEKQMEAPWCVYADFEAINKPIDNKTGAGTHHTSEHTPISARYLITRRTNAIVSVYVSEQYIGEDCASWLIQQLNSHLEVFKGLIKKGQKPPKLTREQERDFQASFKCHICGTECKGDKVRDHDHLTGEYRGCAHNKCNLNWRLDPKKYKLPVFFHNLRGYDSHLLVKAFSSLGTQKISIIPQNFEKYMAITLGGLAFKDSAQFMASSLESLASNLKGNTPITRQCLSRFDSQTIELLCQKGVFPYKWFDSEERLNETKLPSQEDFKNDLTGEECSDKDHKRAHNVWRLTDCKTFKDYHNIYLETDVCLLADVFENFRSLMLSHYKLDPVHYLTAPGMSWDAMLKFTGVELELLTDLNQHLFVEKGIRGGICQVSHRTARANNPQVPNYDRSKPNSWIMYLDMNNLYGGAMCEPLPYAGFKWRDTLQHSIEEEIKMLNALGTGNGAIYEVDLHYPPKLHDLHSDYPLAPEVGNVDFQDLSPWARQYAQKNYKSRKLLLTLKDKERYVLHHTALKKYLKLGLVLKKVHRVLEFKEKPWLKPYIMKNTEYRRGAKNDFEKDFYKLLNNSVFGKTMENVRNRVNISLVRPLTEENRYRKMIAKPTYKSRKIFDEGLVAVEQRKKCCLLNKPIYVGLSILDISKLMMADYWYDHIKPLYKSKARLLYSDTDSFVMSVETPDFYKDNMEKYPELYDTSNFKSGPLKAIADANPWKKKFIGLMKDEFSGNVVESFVGLKPKCYSLKTVKETSNKSKGVKRNITYALTHNDYWGVVNEGKSISHINVGFQTHKHIITTARVNKVSLSPLDTKRWVLADGITSLPYGHYALPYGHYSL